MAVKQLLLELARADRVDDPYAFDFGTEDYLLRGERGGFRGVSLRWNDRLLDDLDALRGPDCDPAVIQRVGDRLRRFVQPADFARHERVITEAPDRGDQVHITIRSSAAELYALPWELLTVAASGQHVGELRHVLLRHAWPETRTTRSDEPRLENGRVLMAWSAAGGTVPHREHESALARACASGHFPFDAERDVLAEVSSDRLEQALYAARDRQRPVAVLHLLCHGAARGQIHGLAWSSDDGRPTGSQPAIIDPGRLRQLLAPHADHLRLVVLCACDSGNLGELGNHLGSLAQNLHTAGIQSVIASRAPLSTRGATRFSQVFYDALLGRPASLERAFLDARSALARDPSNLDWASVQLYARPEDGDDTRPVIFRPYRGLLPFRSQHARYFMGRTGESSEVLSDLQALIDNRQPRFLVVAGASGTGKSSVVMAGAIPQLMAGSDDGPARDSATPIADDDDGPEPEIARALVALQTLERANQQTHNPQVQQGLELLRSGLADARRLAGSRWNAAVMRIGDDPMKSLDTVLHTRRARSRRFLLIVDQFEELFTAIDDHAVRETFVRRLWSLCRDDTGVCCVVTVRVDFLGACGEIVVDDHGLRLDQIAYDEAHRVFVAQMDPAQLRAAIEEPAHLVGLEIEPGLTATMLNDVGGEPGALPLVQYTLDLLWQRRRGRTLSAESYHELGGVTGALTRRADGLIDDLDEVRQIQARRLLVRLVGIDDGGTADTRRRVAIEQLRPTDPVEREAFDRVLDALVGARLLVRSDERGEATIEVAHEALIRRWRRLRQWLHDDRDKLAELHELEAWVEPWQSYGTLLDGDQLGYALRVREKYPDDLDPGVAAMITASVERDQATKRRARLRRRFIVTISLVIAVIMTSLGLWASREAARASREAERAGEQAENVIRANQALEEREKRLQAANRALEQQKREVEDANARLTDALDAVTRQRQRADDEAENAVRAAAAQRVAAARAEQERRRAMSLAEAQAEARDEAERARRQAEKERDRKQKAEEQTARLLDREKKRTRELEKQLNGSILTELPDIPGGSQQSGGTQ